MKITTDALARRVTKWVDLLPALGLNAFEFNICVDDAAEDDDDGTAMASVRISTYYNAARITFREDFLADTTPDRLDRTIVHELLHIVMRDMENTYLNVINYAPGARDDWEEHYSIPQERAIEALARTIVDAHRE